MANFYDKGDTVIITVAIENVNCILKEEIFPLPITTIVEVAFREPINMKPFPYSMK